LTSNDVNKSVATAVGNIAAKKSQEDAIMAALQAEVAAKAKADEAAKNKPTTPEPVASAPTSDTSPALPEVKVSAPSDAVTPITDVSPKTSAPSLPEVKVTAKEPITTISDITAPKPSTPAPTPTPSPTPSPLPSLPETTVVAKKDPITTFSDVNISTPPAPSPLPSLPEVNVVAKKEPIDTLPEVNVVAKKEPIETLSDVNVVAKQDTPDASVSPTEKEAIDRERNIYTYSSYKPSSLPSTLKTQAPFYPLAGTTGGLTSTRGAGELESKETGKARRNVWNEESLRLKDALGI